MILPRHIAVVMDGNRRWAPGHPARLDPGGVAAGGSRLCRDRPPPDRGDRLRRPRRNRRRRAILAAARSSARRFGLGSGLASVH